MIMILAAVAALTSIIMLTIQIDPAYAASSEKISLVQNYEQFSGQEITGFCNVKFDVEGNLHWQIKVNGLVSGTQGQFDLGHWTGDVDVSYTVDEDGMADSGVQIVPSSKIPHPIFTQFAACHVYAAGDSHYNFPGIASAKIDIL